MTKALIIAICGESGAGKSTTTGLLSDAGFKAYSLSAILRQEAEDAHVKPTRSQVQHHGKMMQSDHGNDYYARRLVETTDLISSPRAVVDGMRNLDEVTFLRARAAQSGSELRLLAMVASADLRFERVIGRARDGDPTAKEQFAADDARANGAEGVFQNNRVLIEAADWQIENTGDVVDIRDRLQGLISEVTGKVSVKGEV